jgi:hypothetical protein
VSPKDREYQSLLASRSVTPSLANLWTGYALVYLRPTTRFTVLPRASLLPGLGL